MSNDRDERLSRLGERFSERGTKPVEPAGTIEVVKTEPVAEDKKQRKRRTIYIDKRLITRLEQAFPKFNYEITPKVIEKSDFWELLLEYGLDNLEAVKGKVIEQA